MKGRAGIIVSFVLGLMLVGFGIYRLNSDVVTCEGARLAVGESCRVSGGGDDTFTYEEQRSSQQRGGAASIGVGMALVAFGGWSLGLYLRARKNRRESEEYQAPEAGPRET